MVVLVALMKLVMLADVALAIARVTLIKERAAAVAGVAGLCTMFGAEACNMWLVNFFPVERAAVVTAAGRSGRWHFDELLLPMHAHTS